MLCGFCEYNLVLDSETKTCKNRQINKPIH